jgi:hypothetical protein
MIMKIWSPDTKTSGGRGGSALLIKESEVRSASRRPDVQRSQHSLHRIAVG